MKRRLSFGWLIPLVLVALVSVGCDDSNDAAAVTALGPTTPTTALAATPTGATTTTAPTSTTTPSHKTTSESEPDATKASIEASDVLVPDSWNPILAETTARPAPAAATCPSFSLPEVQDTAPWPIPYLDGVTRSRAVFDQHAGQIIYHDSERTWAFDVCTNTWTRLQDHDPRKPSGWLGAPVYDIDSDKTVSFGYVVAVFDANTGNSTEHANPFSPYGIDGAVYDPTSGLIITEWDDRLLRAYDVDTNTWHEIGVIPTPSEQDSVELHSSVELLGYSPAMDRFIAVIAELSAWPALPVKIPSSVTLLVDPRTGTTSVISTRSPGYPFNPREDSFRYGAAWQTADSAIVDREGFPLCEFSAETLTWDTCYRPPNRATSIDPDSRIPNRSDTFKPSVIVEDTINDRLLFLAFRGYRVPDTWTLDQNTNEWTLIPFAITD